MKASHKRSHNRPRVISSAPTKAALAWSCWSDAMACCGGSCVSNSASSMHASPMQSHATRASLDSSSSSTPASLNKDTTLDVCIGRSGKKADVRMAPLVGGQGAGGCVGGGRGGMGSTKGGELASESATGSKTSGGDCAPPGWTPRASTISESATSAPRDVRSVAPASAAPSAAPVAAAGSSTVGASPMADTALKSDRLLLASAAAAATTMANSLVAMARARASVDASSVASTSTSSTSSGSSTSSIPGGGHSILLFGSSLASSAMLR
mmetsp:Transcript_98870/g.284066  ORF Transcript_98870/g.284066 Transcript_98870/m.284066 type:complete len:268 (-) Transcript_98870:120-923(-)